MAQIRYFFDDVPWVAAPPVIDDDTGYRPVRWPPTFALSLVDVSSASQSPEIRDDDPPFVARFLTSARPWLQAILADNEELASTPAFVGEDDAAPLPTVWRVVAAPALIGGDDDLPPQVSAAFDQDEAWAPAAPARPWVIRVFTDDDAGASLANFPLDAEEPWTAARLATAWVARLFAEDELWPVPPGSFWLDDDPAFVAARVGIVWTPRPFVDDEIGTDLKNFALDTDDGYRIAPAACPSWLATSRFADEELPAPVALEDDVAAPHIRQMVVAMPWRGVATDDDPLAFLTALADDDVPAFVRFVSRWLASPAVGDDELPHPVICEDEAAPSWRVLPSAWRVPAWLIESEEWVTATGVPPLVIDVRRLPWTQSDTGVFAWLQSDVCSFVWLREDRYDFEDERG